MSPRQWVAILLWAPLLVGQAQEAQTPTIRVSTRLVQVNVIVHDKDGRPVANLTKDDFALADRGKAQKIAVFAAESAQAGGESRAVLAPNTFSDEPQYHDRAANGVTVVLLDNLNTLSSNSPQPYEEAPYWLEDHALANAKQHLVEFLRQENSTGRIAIYGLTETLHVLCDFTCTREELLAVVSKYDTTSRTRREEVEPGAFHFPGYSGEDPRSMDARSASDTRSLAGIRNQARSELTMSALSAIAAHVADLPGRKNLLWLTANLPFSGEAVARILGQAGIAAYPVDARGLLPKAPAETWTGVFDADAYAMGQIGRPPAQSEQPIGIDTMQKMADETGGHAFVNANDLTGAIRDVVNDSATTYTLGFYIDESALDDKFHEIKVTVPQPGLKIRAPRGYFALKGTPPNDDERRRVYLNAIRSPLDSSAIRLNVKVSRVDLPASKSLQLVGSIGIEKLGLPQISGLRSGALEIYVIEQDAAGNVVNQSNNRLRLSLTEAQYRDYLKSGIAFRQTVQPAAKTTTVRVLVQEPNSAQLGSVIIPLAQVN